MLRRFWPLLWGAALFAQSDTGELRLSVTDAGGLPLSASAGLSSEGNRLRRTLQTAEDGTAAFQRLPFGVYRLRVEHEFFAPFTALLDIRSHVPRTYAVVLGVAPVETVVQVIGAGTLLDPGRTGSVSSIGNEALQDRAANLPGRSLAGLVDTQPGWLLEANGVLHPRGSEYQTQYVIDGIPLTDNRSPAFSPEIDSDEVQSMTVLTGGYPAEYGRKLGGVIETITARDARPGLHGKLAAEGGSFATASGFAALQYGWGRNTLAASGNSSRTDRYLDPPVEENYTNSGTNAGGMLRFERDLASGGRATFGFRRGQSRFEVPNERVQQEAGQRQDRGSGETAAQFSYQRMLSSAAIGEVRGMWRDLSANLWSNALSTPILATQDRGFREAYLKATASAHWGRQEWKAGAEADFSSVRERFGYAITDPSQFAPGTPPLFRFSDRRQDREQSLFIQDLAHLGNWTFNLGLRWDHYRFVVDESAFSPRAAAAWYWPAHDLQLRGSWDRVFQTPAFENLLLASSAAVDALGAGVLRLPVRPSRGNFYEAGFSKGFFGKARLDGACYRRVAANFADDDLLLNTGVSFPIAFRKAEIRGTEVKLEMPRWGPVSGFISYSNILGVGYLPVTGGLFIGDTSAAAQTGARFPVTQDQRNSVRARFRAQVSPRLWIAAGASYGSGLPVEFDGTYEDALAQYGPRIVDRVNFDRGRVRPSFALGFSAGATLHHTDRHTMRVQADIRNVTNRLNVIDFAGLFSGTAIDAPRSFALRFQTDF